MMLSLLAQVLAVTGVCVASPALVPRCAAAPVVTVKNGSYVGVHNPTYNQDFFFGIRYAKPPIDDLRFRVPQSLNETWTDTRPANEPVPFCVGYGGDNAGKRMSEDCLYLQVVRPSGIAPSTPLPVAVWIHGGGLVEGGLDDQRYNASFIVQNSVEMGTPIMVASLAYRVSAWGFLSSEETLKDGSTNLGFRDQRLALHWLQENIGAFGGAPEQVTIWGESAGGHSVGAQLLAYNGRDDKLFKGAIAQSGGPGIRFGVNYGSQASNTSSREKAYNSVVTASGCTSSPNSLECLRALPFETLNAVINTTEQEGASFQPMIDHDFIAAYGSTQLNTGKFVHVPLLTGSNSDEGSSFAPRTPPCNTEEDFLGLLQTSNISSEAAQSLAILYPDIPALGIPSLKTFPHDPNSTLSQTLGKAYRRVRAYFGDLSMTLKRRASNHAWSLQNVNSFAYRWDVTVPSTTAGNGAEHFQEVAFVFDNTNGLGYAVNPFEGLGDAGKALAKEMSRRWVAFVVSGKPSVGAMGGGEGEDGGSGVEWPVYDVLKGGAVGDGMLFDLEGARVEEDSYRAEAMKWMWDHAEEVYGI
ncbi:hypothetical protein HYFRA_00010834 [Hymenoscyphus fraxineus]|uniref:Carboxylic ester hydrolase n=1 Tax=Hymenoscyphus fraxineus TaxID=746836 RepID=A0A9N9PSW9_9HELO|nr:hypothetical protein HYFRA_00010834 [Hymenoscyphus fraxineus]